MDGRLLRVNYFGVLLVVAAILNINGVNTQVCQNEDRELTFNGDATDEILWRVSWVPGCTDQIRFSVKLTVDAVARIYLTTEPYARASLVAPFYIINLGWNGVVPPNAPGIPGATDLTAVYSYISFCDVGDGPPCNTIGTTLEAQSLANGDVSTASTEFYISTTNEAISVGYAGQSAFITLNGLGSASLNPQNIRFVGVESHDGTNGATFAGQNSLWKFCNDDWNSLTFAAGVTIVGTGCGGCINTIDGDLDTCYTVTLPNPYLLISLGEEKDVVGVTIYAADGPGNPTAGALEHLVVYVGSCDVLTPGADTGPSCGSAVTSAEAANGLVYRACPDKTYGKYVVIRSVPSSTLSICEVVIHGKNIADADKTTVQWTQSTYSAMESPATSGDCTPGGTSTSTVTLELTRSGNTERTLTCNTIQTGDITVTLEGATDLQDYDYTPAQIVFDKGDKTKTINVDIGSDCMYEGDHSVKFELNGQGDQTLTNGLVIGAVPSTTLTIGDDDPIYTFEAPTANVGEDDTKITLNIQRSGYTTAVTTVYVQTMVPFSVTATTGVDFTALEGTSTPIVFGVGETMKSVDIYINDDDGNVDAVDETFDVMLVTGIWSGMNVQGETGPHGTVRVTIMNDDTVYGPCEPGLFYGPENGQGIDVAICRKGKTDTAGCIDVIAQSVSSAGAISAIEGVDFDAYMMAVSFDPNQMQKTITIPVTDDTDVEDDEIFELVFNLPNTVCDMYPVVRSDTFTAAPGTGTARSEATLIIQNDDTISSVTSLTNSVPENIGSVTVSFTRTAASTRESTIMVRVYGATDTSENVGTSFATEGLDFMSAGTHSVTFEEDSLVAQLTIPIIDDTLLELDEVFYVEIMSSDSDINNGRKITEINILNNDASYSIKQAERTVVESVGEFHVVIQRGGMETDNGVVIPPFLDNSVDIAVATNSDTANGATATAGEDFGIVTKIVTFLGTSRDAVKTCAVQIINDEAVEGEEKFFVIISNNNVQIDRSWSNITIEDDDGRIRCSVGGETTVTVDENQGSVTVTCTRDGIVNDAGDDQGLNRVAEFVLSAVSDSARQGDDFNAYRATLEFPAGEATIMETIPNLIIDDSLAEDTETFRLEITDADSEVDATGNTVTINIRDDDTERFRFEMPSYDVGESCQVFQVAIIRTGTGEEGTTLRVSASDGAGGGGAVYPEDYTTRETIVNFLPNQQQQLVTINVNRDNINEGAETFTLSLSKISGSGEVDTSAGVATVTIQDQTVTYSVQDAQLTFDESSGTVPVYFVRSGDFCDADSIYVLTKDGTARARSDYISFSNRRVEFSKNSNTASVLLTILDDNFEEPTETFTIEIQGTNVQVGTATATVTVQDDDGRVNFRDTSYRVLESRGSVTLTIDRVGNTILPSTVRVQTVSGLGTGVATAGVDYTVLTNQFVYFGADERTKTVTVQIRDDDDEEEDETFTVLIIGTTDGVVGFSNEAIVTIEDDDEPSGPALSTGAIIGIAAGVGGGILLLLIIGGIFCVTSMRQPPVRGPPPPPVAYNAPNYPPGYGYQDPSYRPSQRIAYYR